MTEFYSTTDYRKSLRFALDRLALRGEKITNQQLAEAMRVQSPYLSKVFAGAADLNEDQLYMAVAKLRLSEDEHRYLTLLLSYSRASLKERKNRLLLEIQRFQKLKLSPSENRSASHLGESEVEEPKALSRYYLDPWAQIVHMYLLIPKWLKNPLALAEHTRLSKEHLSSILKTLEDLKIIELRSGVYRLLKEQLHLPKSHPLCLPQQNLMRSLALSKTSSGSDETYTFLATLTANEKARVRIQAEFVEFLKRIESIVSAAPSEEVYQIQFDLFPWS